MVDLKQAKELIELLLRHGERLDPEDMSMLYGWIYSSSVALEPFPTEHRRFCEECRDSFDAPRLRLNSGLKALRNAYRSPEQDFELKPGRLSTDYLKLLKKVFPHP